MTGPSGALDTPAPRIMSVVALFADGLIDIDTACAATQRPSRKLFYSAVAGACLSWVSVALCLTVAILCSDPLSAAGALSAAIGGSIAVRDAIAERRAYLVALGEHLVAVATVRAVQLSLSQAAQGAGE